MSAAVEITITDVHFHPDEGELHGRSADGQTLYVLKLANEHEVDAMRENGCTVDEACCPRCDFEDAINVLVYAGEFIRDKFDPDALGQLTAAEVELVDAGRAWLAEYAIARCLDESSDRDER